MDVDTTRKLTVEEAAHLLKISTKTVQRYLAAGRLTKLKINHRTYLMHGEVMDLAVKRRHGHHEDHSCTNAQPDHRDTVTLGRERYEQLLIELGELRKERDYLLAAQKARHDLNLLLESKDAELKELRRLLEKAQAGSAGRESAPPKPALSHTEQERNRDSGPQKPWWHR
jgi:excisionase family DNA binding protein